MDPKARATAAVPLLVGLLAGCISQSMANKARKFEEDEDWKQPAMTWQRKLHARSKITSYTYAHDRMRINQEVRK